MQALFEKRQMYLRWGIQSRAMVLPKCKDLQKAAPAVRNQVALVIFAQNDRERVHVSVKCYMETLQEGRDWRVFECSSRRKGGGPPKCGFSCRQLPSVGKSQAPELDASKPSSVGDS